MAILDSYPNLSEKVYETLKNDILSGQFETDAQMQIVDLARRLGVSRTPVKEALGRLSMEGLIQEVPRKGYFVSNRDRGDIADLLDARLMIELASVQRGIKLSTTTELEQMRLLLHQMDEDSNPEGGYNDYEAFVKKDAEFHSLLVGLAKNRHLLNAYRQLYVHYHVARMRLWRGPGIHRGIGTRREHSLILEALESQDLPALEAAITNHVQETARWWDEAAQANRVPEHSAD